MNGKELLKGIGYVSDVYVEEAGTAPARVLRPRWAPAAVAACLALVLAAGVLLPGRNSGIVLPPDGGQTPVSDGGTGTPSGVLPPQTGAPVIDMESVVFNDLDSRQPDAAPIWLDPAKYDELTWTLADVTAYYGRDPFPAYVPAGLSCPAAAGPDTRWTVYAAKDGTLVGDAVGRCYAAAFHEDGGAVSGALGGKTVSVRCSRLGLMTDCLYLLPENEVKTTDIAGTAVTFGYRQMSRGPYDPETHAPAGYFDLYTAEFTLDGAAYEIVTEGLPGEEIVKVAASIVTGGGAAEVR